MVYIFIKLKQPTLRGQTGHLDRRTILCMYAPGVQRQVFKHVQFCKNNGKERKKKKNKECVLVVESDYNS